MEKQCNVQGNLRHSADTVPIGFIGISMHLSDPFVMGDESRNSRGGSGLGLSVSKKVIDMHGGRLWLEQPSAEGYTKAFCIRIKQIEDCAYEYDYKQDEDNEISYG